MNEKNYKLTIAIPTYNGEKYLGRALDSIISQAVEEVEILVSDNASKDGTQTIVEERIAEGINIRYIRNSENIGPDANFLQCLNKAKGEFVLLLGDDDVIFEGGIARILEFITSNPNCSIVFLNHTFFEGEYDATHCKKPHLENSGNIVTHNKKEFMKFADNRITFMGALLISRSELVKVVAPDKYKDTYFIHTCIAFEISKANDALLGVVSGVCVAQDQTKAISGIDLSSIFKIFGKGMEYTFCQVAPQFGYDKKQMRKIYVKWISKAWRSKILKLKGDKDPVWKSEFKKYGKPVLKKHPIAYMRVMPYVIMPGWFAGWAYRVFRPIYKKIKGSDK